MAKYEYKTVEKNQYGHYMWGESLEELGAQGWELVSSSWDKDTFKREKPKTIKIVDEYEPFYDENGLAIINGKLEAYKHTFSRWCSSNIAVPDGVKEIGDYVFSGSTNLESITIPEGVTKIGDHAFAYCDKLKNIVIPNSVTIIGSFAFAGCNNLNKIVVPNGVTWIGNKAFIKCVNLENIIIPNSVTTIGNEAYLGCTSLRKIIIPEGVTTIDHNAFNSCTNLEYIVIPKSIKKIGAWAFSNTKYYNELSNWKNKALYIGSCLIKVKEEISGSYFVKEGTRFIAEQAFEKCKNLKKVTIPGSVKNIGRFAFDGCSSLENIVIPKGVTGVEESAFQNCSSLTSVTIPDGVTRIGNYAFANCSSLTSIKIPDSITSIGDYAFVGCNSLKKIYISKNVTTIGNCAFKDCGLLTSIELPHGVTSIGDNAFLNCAELQKVVIGKGLKEIGESAFAGCHNLTSVDVDSHMTQELGKNAFKGCNKLTLYGHAEDEVCEYARKHAIPFISIQDFWIEDGLLLAYAGTNMNIIIPEGVKEIDTKAFTYYHCPNVKSVVIPSGVEKIGELAFRDCRLLESVEMPVTLATIGSSAFMGCSSLSNITIPDSVTEIGRSVFYGCNNLSIIASENSCAAKYAKENKIPLRYPVPVTVNKSETKCSDEAILYQKAKACIEVSMGKETKEACYKCLALALLEGASEGQVKAFGYLSYALYQYYKATKDERTEECYNTALNLLAVTLNSSEGIKTLQTIKPFLTPFISVTSFFEMIIAELEFQRDGTSPFKNLELKEFVDIFVRGFKKDAALSTNDALFNAVKKYVELICNHYKLDCATV